MNEADRWDQSEWDDPGNGGWFPRAGPTAANAPRPGATGPGAGAKSGSDAFEIAPSMQWISQNSPWLSVLINAGMLLVWLFYAQLLLTSYRRSRRAKVTIDQGVGGGLRSLCLIANMSSEAIFIQVVVATMYNEEDRLSRAITDLKVRERGEDEGSAGGVSSLQAQTVQGPLHPGCYLDLGTFGEVINAVMAKQRTAGDGTLEEDADKYSLELTVISTFGAENRPIGARRRFEFTRSEAGDHLVRPTTVSTLRLTGIRGRRQMHRWLRQYL